MCGFCPGALVGMVLSRAVTCSFHNLRRSKTLKNEEKQRTMKQEDHDHDDNGQTSAATSSPYLPDNVVEKILSFLPIKDAVRATTVSKQWAALWPCFSVINIDEGDLTNCNRYFKRQRFNSFLRNSLRRCRDQRVLDKLRFRTECEFGEGRVLVNEWVEFAVLRCVKELEFRNLGENCCFLIAHDVLTLQSLTSLELENVRLYASSGINGPVSLPLLKTMSLKEVTFLDDQEDTATCAFPSLLSGCPCIEHLSIDTCNLGYSTLLMEISSDVLKSLKIMHCHSSDISVNAKKLESFVFYSDCSCRYHKVLYLWECHRLKHVDISCKGLKLLLLHKCLQTIENSFCTPNLESFEFSGFLKTKVLFAEAPSNLVKATIRVWETKWPIEYYSAMRDFLESFDCSKKVKIHIEEAEGVLIPKHLRLEWSPPLPSIKQLQLYFPAPLGDKEYCLRPSLNWMAPSAEILPFLMHDDDDEYENYEDDDDNFAEEDNDYDDDDDDDDNIADEDYDNDDDSENVDDDDDENVNVDDN